MMSGTTLFGQVCAETEDESLDKVILKGCHGRYLSVEFCQSSSWKSSPVLLNLLHSPVLSAAGSIKTQRDGVNTNINSLLSL